MSASIEESASNPWARICDLVDLKKPIVSSKASSSSISGGGGGGGGGGSGSGTISRKGSKNRGMDEDNVFRATEKMRSLIIQVCVCTGWTFTLGQNKAAQRSTLVFAYDSPPICNALRSAWPTPFHRGRNYTALCRRNTPSVARCDVIRYNQNTSLPP